MKKTYLFVLMMSLSFLVKAQFSTELQNVFQIILDEKISDTGATGLSVSVISADNQWAAAAGLHSTDSLLTPNSAFGMGSISKTIISATILRMMEDGLLSLSDPISFYLDTMANIPPDVTIRQLLNHTSGIYNFSEHPNDILDYYLSNLSELVTAEFILENFLDSPIFAPGTQFSYSNSNYLLLGLIIEEISGQAYYLEARELFDFGANYPSFTVPPYESDLTELAHIFADTSNIIGPNPIDIVEQGYILSSVFSGSGAAGAYASTPSDLAKWAYDLYSGNILEAATMDSLFTLGMPSSNYGLGVVIFEASPCGHFLGHDGETFYTASAFYNPENDIAVSVQCNDATNPELTLELAVELACAYYEYSISTNTEYLSSNESIDIFPNPFSDAFTLKYESQNRTEVQVALYNEIGLKVEEWFLGAQTTGEHLIQLDTNVPNGIYFLKFRTGNNVYTERIIKM